MAQQNDGMSRQTGDAGGRLAAASRGTLTRREVLMRAGALSLSAGSVAALLAACGGSSIGPTATSVPTGTKTASPQPAGSAVSATSQTASASASKASGPIRVGMTGDGKSLDPADWVVINERHYIPQIFDNLIEINDAYDLAPGLATSWDASADGLTWTFHLQSGVKFHDGTAFDAAAVKFNLDRTRDPANAIHHSADLSVVTSVDVVDPLTVQVVLQQAFTPFLATLTEAVGYMSSPDAIKKYGKEYAVNPVGTGPFQFVEWVRDSHLTLKRFDGYWRQGLPRASGVVFQPIPDTAVKLTVLRTGSIDIVDSIDPKDVAAVSADASLKLYSLKGSVWPMLRLNTAVGPFTNTALRQAVASAINRDNIVKAVYFGHAEPAYGPIPPLYKSVYDPNIKQSAPTYDPAQAKQKIVEGGQPNGFSFQLNISNTPDNARMAELIQSDLTAVGIKMQINSLESAAFTTALQGKKFDAALGSWTPRADVDGVMYQHFHSKGLANWVSYHNPTVDSLLDKTRSTPPGVARNDLFKQAAQIIAQEVPWVVLVFQELDRAARASVAGYAITPDTLLHLVSVSTGAV
ncbi:MAG: ABC transporter substrate-binding protein [Thermomicrobiales bacterium]